MILRAATKADIPALASIHIEGWRAAYGGQVDQDYLENLSLEERTREWCVWMESGESDIFIAEEEGVPAGFIMYGRTKTVPPGSSNIRPTHAAEIYALYLLPEFWRRGMGRALLKKSAEVLKEKKQKTLCLWVLDGNERAKSFYESLGGQRIGKHMIEIGPSKVKEICYGWRDIDLLL